MKIEFSLSLVFGVRMNEFYTYKDKIHSLGSKQYSDIEYYNLPMYRMNGKISILSYSDPILGVSIATTEKDEVVIDYNKMTSSIEDCKQELVNFGIDPSKAQLKLMLNYND